MTVKNQPLPEGSEGIEHNEGGSFSNMLHNYQSQTDDTSTHEEVVDVEETTDDDNLDEELEDGDVSDDDTTEDIDVDSLRDELRKARDVSIHKNKLRKEARADARQLEELLEQAVIDNPEYLMKIHSTDPDRADRISKKVFNGMTYDELLQEAQRQNNNEGQTYQERITRGDIRKELDNYFAERETQQEHEKIESAELDFFKGLNLNPKSAKFQNIMKAYNEFSPKSVKEAKVFLEHARNSVLSHSENNKESINNVPSHGSRSGSFSSGKQQTKKISAGMQFMAKRMGISTQKLNEYYNKKK